MANMLVLARAEGCSGSLSDAIEGEPSGSISVRILNTSELKIIRTDGLEQLLRNLRTLNNHYVINTLH